MCPVTEEEKAEAARLVADLRKQLYELVGVYQTRIKELEDENLKLTNQLNAAKVKLMTIQAMRAAP